MLATIDFSTVLWYNRHRRNIIMPRPGYTNVGPSETRQELIEIICKHLVLDVGQHGARIQAIDYALRLAARELQKDDDNSREAN
jgi:hypothetical protein